jgi:hypothetical protein
MHPSVPIPYYKIVPPAIPRRFSRLTTVMTGDALAAGDACAIAFLGFNFLYPLHQDRFNFRRDRHAANHVGKKGEGAIRRQCGGELDRREVIVQKGTTATRQRVTARAHPGGALRLRTQMAQVVSRGVRHEYIRSMIVALRIPFQPPGSERSRGQVCFVGDGISRSTSFGSGFSVAKEPTRAMRTIPGNWMAANALMNS